MYKNFCKYLTCILAISLLSSCTGEDCIEADDFGEYDYSLVNIEAKVPICDFTDNNEDAITGDSNILSCLEKGQAKFYSDNTETCYMSSKGGGNNISLNNIRDICVIGGVSNCLDSFNFSGCELSKTEDEKNAQVESVARGIFQVGINKCLNDCMLNSQEAEPLWQPNTAKLDSSSANGIAINRGSSIKVEASGAISLQNSDSKGYSFGLTSKFMQESSMCFTKNTNFFLSGNWCNGNLSNGDCTTLPKIGEFKAEDEIARLNFFRRGVVILEDATLSETSVGMCADKKKDEYFWRCNLVNVTTNPAMLPVYIPRCASLSNTTPSGDNIDSNYAIETDFVKKVGGTIVPSDVVEYMTYFPFDNIFCRTKTNLSRECGKKVGEELDIIAIPQIVNTIMVPNVSVENTNKEMRIADIMQFKNSQAAAELELFSPSKLAFKILLNDTGKKGSGECSVSIINGDQTETLIVKPDNTWYFLNDESGIRKNITKSKFSRAKPAKNDLSASSKMVFDDENKYNIEIIAEGSWKDEEEKDVKCGDGMAILTMPQNDILINSSGFVTFKNGLRNNNGEISCELSSNNSACEIESSLKFTIINPLFDLESDINVGSLSDANFYEYKTIDKNKQTYLPTSTVINNVNSNTWTNNSTFVRKGQILRFDESNWYKIEKVDDAGYSIKEKIVLYNGSYTKKAGSFLVKINPRLAIICSDDGNEKAINPECNQNIVNTGNSEAQVSCKVEPQDVLNTYCTNLETNPSTYCPTTCFGDFKIPGFESSSSLDEKGKCLITESSGSSFSKARCQACANLIVDKQKNTSPFITQIVLQCYDLESYKGAMDTLFMPNNIITGQMYSKMIDSEDDVSNNGLLTEIDRKLGAQKLKSIFNSDGLNYGNLNGMQTDNFNIEGGFPDSSAIYKNTEPLIIKSTKKLNLLVIDNKNFTFRENNTDPYIGNIGQYKFTFTPKITLENGKQLAVFIGLNNFPQGSASQIINSEQNPDQNSDASGFKYWIVKYNLDRSIATGENQNQLKFGTLDPSSPYYFDSLGRLVNKADNSVGIEMANIAGKIKNVKDEDFDKLRLFFKIIDQPEANNCKNTLNPTNVANNTRFYTPISIQKCKCGGKGIFVDCSTDCATPTQKTARDRCYATYNTCLAACSDSTCSANCLTASDNCIKKIGILNLEVEEYDDCRSFYTNNDGSYTIKLKAETSDKSFLAEQVEKASTQLTNSSIVKDILGPLLRILDGKKAGFEVDINGNKIPCNSERYIYGGTLPVSVLGENCATNHPEYGTYCLETTKFCGADASNPKSCFLPGAIAKEFGKECNPIDSNNIAEDGSSYCRATQSASCSIFTNLKDANARKNDFGEPCSSNQQFNSPNIGCYQNCNALDTQLYKTNCKFENDGQGFLQRFYQAVVNDNAYQNILKLCLVLMVTFYGLYYLMGMADLTQSELIKRVIKIGFIYLMIGPDGWYYYNKFFVSFFKDGVDYLVFAIAGAFDTSNSSLAEAFIKNDFYDKSVLFSGVEKNLKFIFSDKVTYKIYGLFFVSFFGWLYTLIILYSILTYIFAVANAILFYLTAQFFISLLLAFGPIFFILLIFDKTKDMFNKWISNLISFSLEQIFLLTCLSLFNMLIYNIMKFVLSYRVCWQPVWVINIPVLGQIELFNFWKATTTTSPDAAADTLPGLFQILLIYLIASLMKKFIELMTSLGSSLGGGGLGSVSATKNLRDTVSKAYSSYVAEPFKKSAKGATKDLAKKMIRYQSTEEMDKESKTNSVLRNGVRSANNTADKAVDQYKKDNADKLSNMPPENRREAVADIRKQAFNKHVEGDTELKNAMQEKKITGDQFFNSDAGTFRNSNNLVSLIGGKVNDMGGTSRSGARRNEQLTDSMKKKDDKKAKDGESLKAKSSSNGATNTRSSSNSNANSVTSGANRTSVHPGTSELEGNKDAKGDSPNTSPDASSNANTASTSAPTSTNSASARNPGGGSPSQGKGSSDSPSSGPGSGAQQVQTQEQNTSANSGNEPNGEDSTPRKDSISSSLNDNRTSSAGDELSESADTQVSNPNGLSATKQQDTVGVNPSISNGGHSKKAPDTTGGEPNKAAGQSYKRKTSSPLSSDSLSSAVHSKDNQSAGSPNDSRKDTGQQDSTTERNGDDKYKESADSVPGSEPDSENGIVPDEASPNGIMKEIDNATPKEATDGVTTADNSASKEGEDN